jgi:hypothetical protein
MCMKVVLLKKKFMFITGLLKLEPDTIAPALSAFRFRNAIEMDISLSC